MPFDMVKLDRDLTAELGSGSAAALFRAVVALADDLQLTVVAEGIENLVQPELVREAGCHLGQGYRWGRPSTLDELIDRWASTASSAPTVATQVDPPLTLVEPAASGSRPRS